MIRLGGEVGLHSFEIPQEKPKHVRRSEDGEHYFLRVPRGKDTSGTGGKPRDAFLPRDLETRLHRYARDNEIGDDEAYFSYSPRWVQERVKLAAENVYEESGDEDWLKVSSHDLRVYFGHTMLVKERMNPEVVMDVGGWEDYDHDGTGEGEYGHDVTEEGLHIDIFRDGETEATEYISPPQPAAIALDRAEDHLSKNLERFISRYEQWHGINNR